jgi:Uma2 family endonuclease
MIHENTKRKLSPSAFLDWVQVQEGRYELKDGVVRDISGGTRAHALVRRELALLLIGTLEDRGFSVLMSNLAVKIGNDIRYPDIVVEPAGSDPQGLVSMNPGVIVEVVSVSSRQSDLHEKVEEYLSLPSLQAYIVASEEEPCLWVWQRGPTGDVPTKPEIISGADKTLDIPRLGVSIKLGEVFAPIMRVSHVASRKRA